VASSSLGLCFCSSSTAVAADSTTDTPARVAGAPRWPLDLDRVDVPVGVGPSRWRSGDRLAAEGWRSFQSAARASPPTSSWSACAWRREGRRRGRAVADHRKRRWRADPSVGRDVSPHADPAAM